MIYANLPRFAIVELDCVAAAEPGWIAASNNPHFIVVDGHRCPVMRIGGSSVDQALIFTIESLAAVGVYFKVRKLSPDISYKLIFFLIIKNTK